VALVAVKLQEAPVLRLWVLVAVALVLSLVLVVLVVRSQLLSKSVLRLLAAVVSVVVVET
jgi:hypothetical protein